MISRKAVDSLRNDHEEFRILLTQLDALIEHGEAARRAIHELSVVLASQLRSHIRREGRLAVLCSRLLGTWNAETLARFSVDHHVDQEYLRVVSRCAAKTAQCSIAGLTPALNGLRTSLREHMAQQDAELFPLLEDVVEGSRRVVSKPQILPAARHEFGHPLVVGEAMAYT